LKAWAKSIRHGRERCRAVDLYTLDVHTALLSSRAPNENDGHAASAPSETRRQAVVICPPTRSYLKRSTLATIVLLLRAAASTSKLAASRVGASARVPT
jgi:hypothetical protein